MGRLEDIAERNRRAMSGDSPLIRAMDRLGGDKPPESVARFTLPSQRKTGTAAWKVIVVMVLAGIGAGFFSCRMMEHDEHRLQDTR